mgnify:CR=1 FL=1
MNRILKYTMMAFMVLSTLAINAQSRNQKTETVKIYGNCGMCETRIENAGNIKNQSNVDWDKETKMANISYDSLKTSKEEILKRIALAGYDSDIFLAPQDTYSNLPICCQYERAKIAIVKMDESIMDSETKDQTAYLNNMAEMQDEDPLSAVYNSYFAVKNSLVDTNGEAASANAKDLLTAVNNVKMDKLTMDVHMVWMNLLEDLKKDIEQIADTKETSRQRANFNTLSKNIYEVIKISKQKTPTYYQFCPMANDGKGANWLSKEEIIKNPYYGAQMLSCGKTVETIQN